MSTPTTPLTASSQPQTPVKYSAVAAIARYQRFQRFIFALTFVSYALLHLARKTYANMKMKLESEAAFDATFLSVMDTAFMLFYALGSFISGVLGVCVFIFASCIWMDIEFSHNELIRTALPLFLWAFHGLFQSICGPATTSIMSNWFGYRNRGYIFGLWTCHQYVGNICASLLCYCVLSHTDTLSWPLVFPFCAFVCCSWAVVTYYHLFIGPGYVPGLEVIEFIRRGDYNPHSYLSINQDDSRKSRRKNNHHLNGSGVENGTSEHVDGEDYDDEYSGSRLDQQSHAHSYSRLSGNNYGAILEMSSPRGQRHQLQQLDRPAIIKSADSVRTTSSGHDDKSSSNGAYSYSHNYIAFTHQAYQHLGHQHQGQRSRSRSRSRSRTAAAHTLAIINPGITLFEALRLPQVVCYCLALGCFKFVHYAMFFWLPFYLSQHYDAPQSNLLSLLYDVGMLPGSVLLGWLSDRLYRHRRAWVIATCTSILLPCLILCGRFDVLGTWGHTQHPCFLLLLLLLALMGCLIGGPVNMITGTVAVDLSEHAAIGGRADLMTVTGLINGSGSCMASLGLVIIGPLVSRYGWRQMWYLLSASTFLGTLFLVPALRKELSLAPTPRSLPRQRLSSPSTM